MMDREQLAGFAADVAGNVAPIANTGEEGRVNRRLIRALADEGLLGALFPRRAGGTRDEGVSAVDLCVVREALGRASTKAENAVAIQTLGAYPIVLAGSDEAVARYAGPVARGESVAAFALTEPGAGTDAGALTLQAERDGKGYRLSGTKVYISNAPDADVYTIFARTTPGAGTKGITAFIVSADAKGLSGTALHLLSAHPIGRLELDGVFVPEHQVLGEVDGGFKLAMRTLDLFRPSVGASVIGMAQAALDAAIGHAASREAFGRPIKDFQAVSHQLAEMATRLEAVRALLGQAALAVDEAAPDAEVLCNMVKLFASEEIMKVAQHAVELHGGNGMMLDFGVEKLLRDAAIFLHMDGTVDVSRLKIVKAMFPHTAGKYAGPE